MMNSVVDTDVASFMFKSDSRAAFYEARLVGLSPTVSFMTIAEMDGWALRYRWGPAQTAQMEAVLQSRFVTIFADRDLCRLWAEVTVSCRRAGRPIETSDAWIATTALKFGVPLFTHNRSDYAGVPNLSIISAAP
jgi:predicted nucleic acid-binding protein